MNQTRFTFELLGALVLSIILMLTITYLFRSQTVWIDSNLGGWSRVGGVVVILGMFTLRPLVHYVLKRFWD